jgi:hypothetical protein
MDDEEKLYYLCATLKEVIRLYPVVSVNRLTRQQLILGKYTMPKGALPIQFCTLFPAPKSQILVPGNKYFVLISSPEYTSQIFDKYGEQLISKNL